MDVEAAETTGGKRPEVLPEVRFGADPFSPEGRRRPKAG